MSNQPIDERITINPAQCGGRPCLRGMRIRVQDIVELSDTGLAVADILEELPDLDVDDVIAALSYHRS